MHKHRGFPSRMPSSDIHFTLRRDNKDGATPLKPRKRFADRRPLDRAADREFLRALIVAFGEQPFVRGNLDAGRLSWLLGREVVFTDDEPDPASYDTQLCVDMRAVYVSFPELTKEVADA